MTVLLLPCIKMINIANVKKQFKYDIFKIFDFLSVNVYVLTIDL